MDDTKWFIGLLLIIGLLWISGKARSRPPEAGVTATSTVQTTTTPPPPPKAAPAGGNPPAGTVISSTVAPQPDPNTSPLKGKLVVAGGQLYGAVEQEYIAIQAPSANTENILITGLSIRSAETFNSQTIDKGWSLVYPNSTGEGENVFLKPGGVAYLISGRSPMALTTGSLPSRGGFQLNKCTGFFEQGLNFYHGLPIECPAPVQEPLPQPPNRLSDACYDYLASIPRCTVPSGTIPQHLMSDGSCQSHLFNKISYNQCVSYHREEPDFYKNDWRMYFGRNSKFWRDRREVVELVDAEGKIIDRRVY